MVHVLLLRIYMHVLYSIKNKHFPRKHHVIHISLHYVDYQCHNMAKCVIQTVAKNQCTIKPLQSGLIPWSEQVSLYTYQHFQNK